MPGAEGGGQSRPRQLHSRKGSSSLGRQRWGGAAGGRGAQEKTWSPAWAGPPSPPGESGGGRLPAPPPSPGADTHLTVSLLPEGSWEAERKAGRGGERAWGKRSGKQDSRKVRGEPREGMRRKGEREREEREQR